MKTILVPTDFSPAAKNAIVYASSFAKDLHAQLELLHVYYIPGISARAPYVAGREYSSDEYKQAEQQLSDLALEMPELKNAEYKIKSAPAYWPLEVAEVIQTQHAALTIIGTTGAGSLKKILMGSNTANVIECATRPVLAIPEHAHYKPIQKIALAIDLQSIDDMTTLDPLVSLAGAFKADIHIFHVKNMLTAEAETPEQSENLANVRNYLGTDAGAYTEFYGEGIEDGINKFIEKYNIDILAMIPRKRNLFQRLFKSSLTQKMTFHTKTPLLAIPEKTTA